MRVVHELDTTAWNEFLQENPTATIYHTPEMFEVFSRARSHVPELWAVVGHQGQTLALLVPVQITLLSNWFRGFTTRAVSYGSFLTVPGSVGKAALECLLESYSAQVGKHVLFTELRNQTDLSAYQSLFAANDFIFEEHLNFLIDLTLKQEELWSKINKSGRNRIRAAPKKGLRIEEATDVAGLYAAYVELERVYAHIGVPLADISLFQAAWDTLAPRGMLKIFLANLDSKCIGARILLAYKNRVIDWYAGADREYAAYSPNEALVWHTLEWSKAQGYEIFDFGGGGNPNEPYGPREFKLKFGGTQVNYGRNVCVHAPLRFNLGKAGYGLYRRLPRRSRPESTSIEI